MPSAILHNVLNYSADPTVGRWKPLRFAILFSHAMRVWSNACDASWLIHTTKISWLQNSKHTKIPEFSSAFSCTSQIANGCVKRLLICKCYSSLKYPWGGGDE